MAEITQKNTNFPSLQKTQQGQTKTTFRLPVLDGDKYIRCQKTISPPVF